MQTPCFSKTTWGLLNNLLMSFSRAYQTTLSFQVAIVLSSQKASYPSLLVQNRTPAFIASFKARGPVNGVENIIPEQDFVEENRNPPPPSSDTRRSIEQHCGDYLPCYLVVMLLLDIRYQSSRSQQCLLIYGITKL